MFDRNLRPEACYDTPDPTGERKPKLISLVAGRAIPPGPDVIQVDVEIQVRGIGDVGKSPSLMTLRANVRRIPAAWDVSARTMRIETDVLRGVTVRGLRRWHRRPMSRLTFGLGGYYVM